MIPQSEREEWFQEMYIQIELSSTIVPSISFPYVDYLMLHQSSPYFTLWVSRVPWSPLTRLESLVTEPADVLPPLPSSSKL